MSALAASGDHLLAHGARRRGDRDDHLGGAHAIEDARQLAGRAEHLVARHAHALLARVVVDEADRRGAQPRVAAQLEGDLLAAVPGAHDQDLVGGPLEDRPARRALDQRPHGEARARREHERQQEVEREDRSRRVVAADREEEEHDDHADRRDHDRLQDRLEVALIDEAPELRIEPEQREDHQLHDDDQDDRLLEQAVVARRDRPVEAQAVGEVVGEPQKCGVDADLTDPADVH